jgi:hypothetical protein
MNAPEGTQVSPEPGASPFTGVSVHLTSAITIVNPRPLPHAVAHRGMGWMTASIARPRVECRTPRWDVRRDEGCAGRVFA